MKRFHGVSFLAGLALMALVAGIGMDVINSGWQETVANHKKLERTLMDRIELRDQQDMAAARETATVKTVLIEDAHVGAMRAAWTVPGRVVPHTDDGRLGAYYTYLDSAGHIDGWRGAARDEAPNVLDVTMGSAVPPAPAAPIDSTGNSAALAQHLMEILKAARGARP